MTQEEYDNIQERLSKGYDLRQTIARIEKDLNTMLDARKQTANYLPEITLRWQYMYNIEWLEISEDTKRKIMDLVTDDLVARLEQLSKIISRGYKIDFNQALDARLVNETNAELLARCKWIDRIKFGCDTHKQIEDCERAIALLERSGYRGDFMLFTMIGGKNDFAECFERVNYWRKRLLEVRETHKGNLVYPYAQPYRDPTKQHHSIPMWQKDMAHWCNKHMVFWSTEFKYFQPRKNFKCKEYFK